MASWLNYHHLYYFKIIAEEGSISAAAKRLRLGQPTLSAQLKTFEEYLGITLFERNHKRLVLTEQGKVALDYAKSIFSIGAEMVEVLNDRIDLTKVVLNVGALDSVPKQIIAGIVTKALSIGNVRICLHEGKQDDLFRELVAYRLDIVVTNHLPAGKAVVGDKTLFHRRITRKPVAFYGAPRFRGLRKNFPQSLNGVPMILPTIDSKLRQDVDQWMRSQGIAVNAVVESQDIAVKKSLAAMAIGVIPTATHTVASQVVDRELIEIGLLTGVFEELYLVAADRRIANPVGARLMKDWDL